ncbi:hypothetical protein HMN09_00966600 [Mycena chlorophos]|uniref:Uncharacterized protein n=1 Tax=Mycena chlorophos TaxID=658473 RepID=A0A8H6VZM8_MYCCL|nr:hypothetical protein HMN09_00966600 [Mycena chlorophos]
MHFTASTLVSLLAMAGSTLAAPTPLGPQELIVVSPQITSPKAGDVWPAGSTQTCTWKTNNIPPAAAGQYGALMLGHVTEYTASDGTKQENENIDMQHPMAMNFRLMDGNVTFVVPSTTPPRNDYRLVLFGDSGNLSPPFAITTAAATPDLLALL